MGESFKNLIRSTLEKKPEPLYDKEGISIQRFEDSKAEVPKSLELQEKYPELYDFLIKKNSKQDFKVGIIHLDGGGAISKKLAISGKNPLQIALTLRQMFINGLGDIARKIKENPDSDLNKISYLMAVSRFGSVESLTKKLGLETFAIDDNEELKFNSSSHKRNLQTYDILLKNMIVNEKIKKDITDDPKPAKIILISKQTLLDLGDKKLD